MNYEFPKNQLQITEPTICINFKILNYIPPPGWLPKLSKIKSTKSHRNFNKIYKIQNNFFFQKTSSSSSLKKSKISTQESPQTSLICLPSLVGTHPLLDVDPQDVSETRRLLIPLRLSDHKLRPILKSAALSPPLNRCLHSKKKHREISQCTRNAAKTILRRRYTR